ncbi:PREDICTED: serine/threonine-protein phosphatase 6 regulatory ankyrin repeat subunit B-like [Vollenhovia emeryi]|uniref:serine/threonine-protein phosphatase 6 regulatory ankyrin repeat subunit B-like n=1 Tax=Vollenhovia emeryi TaxID=411798 RepID=UPI0005F4CBD5|nr:PREDICTED: serine/threonine-protein phosphatase 6 regulatory ankyrin repeat subunit B-like [Vollenhovia emeryi]
MNHDEIELQKLVINHDSSPNIMENLHKLLLGAIECEDFESFEQIVKENSKELPAATIVRYVDPNTEDTYLDVASRKGLVEFVDFLLRKGAEVNRVNGRQNGAPIHFAVKGGHVDTLAILLAQCTIDLDLEVGQRTALHIAVENNDLMCADLLLKEGASANVLNNENLTALHLAAMKDQRGMVEMMLAECAQGLELDRYKDCNNQTTREVVEQKMPELSKKLPFKRESREVNAQDLKYHLNNRDEANFLKCMENIWEEIPPGTAENLLRMCTQHNFQQAVMAILERFEGKPGFSVREAALAAFQSGHHVIFKELLKVEPEMGNDLILRTCRELKIESRKQGGDSTSNLQKCVEILVQNNVNVRCADNTDMDLEENSEQDRLLSVYDLSPANKGAFYKLLLKSMLSNDFRTFKNALDNRQQPNVLHVNYVYPYNDSEETLLDIASKSGSTEFVKLLLHEGANPNRINIMYNRAPIHFATEGGHVATLAVLLAEPTINPNLEAGRQTALHIAVRKNDLTCAGLLLEKGASASIPNNKGLTALHLAAMKGQCDMVELILGNSQQYPDIDTYKDYNDQTTREVIQQILPDVSLKCENREVNVHDLKYYLTANDEKNFLNSMKLVKTKVLHNETEELLQMAVEHNLYKSVFELLERLEEEWFSVKKAAEIAVLNGHVHILQLLLRVQPEVANDLILSACQQLGMPKRRKGNDTDRLMCVKLILEQENVDVHCTDSKGNTPLHYAARADNREAMSLLLKRGSYIGHMNEFNVPPIVNIPACTLSRHFDDCLRMLKEWTNKYVIEFDYCCLMPHDVLKKHEERRLTREMVVFQYIAGNNDLKHLLTHPILSSFLYLKRQNIRHILCAHFVLYTMFYILLNFYILSTSFNNPANETEIFNDNVTLKNPLQIVCHQDISLWILIILLLLLFIFWEILQFISCPRNYLLKLKLTNLDSWLHKVLILLTVALICGAHQVGTLLILLSVYKLIILISYYTDRPTSIEMFRTVSGNYVRLFFPHVLFVIAFALVFYTLFKDNTNFSDPMRSIFKTIVMLTGELDTNEIPFVAHPFWSRFAFILFIFFIVIVLLNLLNGLAVNDTTEILSNAELIGLISTIRTLAYLEDMTVSILFKKSFRCGNSRFLRYPFRFLAKKLFLFPHYLTSGKVNVKLYDSTNEKYNQLVAREYVCRESVNRDKYWPSLRMDPNIVEQAKQIILSKNRLSDNENIMMELKKLRDEMMILRSKVVALATNNTSKHQKRTRCFAISDISLNNLTVDGVPTEGKYKKKSHEICDS